MPTTSPFANLYLKLVDRLTAEVPELRYIDQDYGQLENYTLRPPVSFPCLLIEMGDFDFEDLGGTNMQTASGLLLMRLAGEAWSASNNLSTGQIMEKALEYYDLEQKIYVALHGWRAEGFSRLLRRKAVKEQRDDTNVRVRVLAYEWGFQDDTASPVKVAIARPEPIIVTDII